MYLSKLKLKSIGLALFVITFLFTSHANSLDKFDRADRVSDYFAGILSFNENEYEESYKFFRKLDGLEFSHPEYSAKYLYSLVNSGNFREAFNYSKKLERQNVNVFESRLVLGIYYLKYSKLDLAKENFQKAKETKRSVLNDYVTNSLNNWSNLRSSNLNNSMIEIKKIDERFENLKKIQNIFLNCYYDSPNTENLYKDLISNKKTDFSRYNYFYASFMFNSGKTKEAKQIVNSALKSYPRNLKLNQFKADLNENKNISIFNCKNEAHVSAEILYITANALSSQSIYPLSNFYLNLAKFLNEDFHSYDTLLAENFYKIENFKEAKKIYNSFSKKGEAYSWYSAKQLARIYLQEEEKEKAIKIISDTYDNLINKEIYETFDYAEFLKNNEKFKESIKFYSEIISKVKNNHSLYAEATDGRGIAYERIGEWENAEKDLLASLKANPDQAYVINYLAYSWIEQGVKIEQSLSMLEKANKLRSNDPYIIDSLGWALFKLKRFKESKKYLQLAVRLMPGDPIVNDHYGDVLWKNGNEIQARYYWNYVLNLEKTEDELKKVIEEKLTKGL
jgi:tetratricopeptide (TPR) repeat protein|tara:strand:+ start:1610 stop:3301 length:1692 start_codon:yes stop_codon:yes gene_type:complete